MNDLYDEMERYLAGEMSELERTVFSQKLAVDDELSAEVAVMKMARESIVRQAATEKEVAELRAVMGKAAATTAGRRVILKKTWLRTAAGVAAAAVMVLLVWIGWPDSDTLYQQYAEHPRLEMAQRTTDDQASAGALEAAFNRQDYLSAGHLIEAYAGVVGWNTELRLFAGICQLEIENYPAAEAQFSTLYRGESANKWAGAWYLALTYLRRAEAGEKAAYQQSEQLLKQIPEGSDYHERALELLEGIQGRVGG